MSSKNDKSKPNFKARLLALQYLPRLLGLLWSMSPLMTLGNSILRIIRSTLPFVYLYIGKLMIDDIILIVNHNPNVTAHQVWQLLGVQFALAVLLEVINNAIMLMDDLTGILFSNNTSIMIVAHAATIDLDQFEDSVFYDKLDKSRQQSAGRVQLLNEIMTQFQDLMSIIFFRDWIDHI